jgi:hypothetical protein
MRIAIDPTQTRLAVLDGATLRLFDVRGDAALESSSAALDARVLASCGPCVAGLVGELSPAGASLSQASVHRFTWELAPLDTIAVGEVELRGLSLSADGSRLVVTDWSSCRVTLYDTGSGRAIAAAGQSIPSGAAIAADASKIICGTADQGSGAILFFDLRELAGDKLPLEKLAPPKPSPGLDDAPYFGIWSADGRLAALSNQTWGGRGVFVYADKQPLWSLALEPDEEECEPEDWYPMPMAFTPDAALLLVAQRGAIRGYRASDGEDLGAIEVDNGDGSMGFAVQAERRRLWLPGPQPRAYQFAAAW